MHESLTLRNTGRYRGGAQTAVANAVSTVGSLPLSARILPSGRSTHQLSKHGGSNPSRPTTWAGPVKATAAVGSWPIGVKAAREILNLIATGQYRHRLLKQREEKHRFLLDIAAFIPYTGGIRTFQQ